MPVFAGGSQDPVKWLEEFNRAAEINQYTDNYKLKVVGRYLHGAAGQWFREIQEGERPIAYWTSLNRPSFETSFLTNFRTDALINMNCKLESKNGGETVDQYANDVKDDGVKKRKFGNS